MWGVVETRKAPSDEEALVIKKWYRRSESNWHEVTLTGF
jgi:hypothetical protein